MLLGLLSVVTIAILACRTSAKGLSERLHGWPRRYSHVLKTDDDCYVRLGPLAATLRSAAAPPGGADDASGGLFRMRKVYTGEQPISMQVLPCNARSERFHRTGHACWPELDL
jgi:hypothetical protein